MNTYKPPINSKIHIESKGNELAITLPHRVASFSDKFCIAVYFISSIFLIFLSFLFIQEIFREKNITNDELFWLVMLILGGSGALWTLNIIFRKKISETIILKPQELLFNSGVSPIYCNERQDKLMSYSYLQKSSKAFSRQDLNSLVLSKIEGDSLYLLTFEDDSKKNIFFAYLMTNEERKWLYETILKFYNLENSYKVIVMEESRPRKRKEHLFIWIVSILRLFFVVTSVMRSM